MFASNTSAANGAATYIEDVFSTYLYTGNGSTQTITNGIDLAGKGGLVWLKKRDAAQSHYLIDTARGGNYNISSDSTTAQSLYSGGLVFNSSGFSLASGYSTSANTYASWTFREQPKFFDVVTYTGTGSARTIAHNLGSVPGCIIVKRTNGVSNWAVYHRSVGNAKYLNLNNTNPENGWDYWNYTDPTSTVFSLGANSDVNGNGSTYVAYLFAHDAGGFGLTGTDNVISCGSFTTDGSGNATVNLGYEPQWVMVKNSQAAGYPWYMADTMRGMSVGSNTMQLLANSTAAEASMGAVVFPPNATGFNANLLAASNTYIYIAIRRGPMKTPTSGTSVFAPVARTGTGAAAQITGLGFSPDLAIGKPRTGYAVGTAQFDRLRGTSKYLAPSWTDAEITDTTMVTSFNMDGISLGADTVQKYFNGSSGTYANWLFRRAPGFFDMVCYTGTGATIALNHNLAAVPELMIVKSRGAATGNWVTYTATYGSGSFIRLNSTSGNNTGAGNLWGATTPTSSLFYVGEGGAGGLSVSANNYVAYLFASCPGVSKVGSYTGTGTTQQINCGFTGGARFVLIKRTDSTGDWYVWDTARGIVAGNDPYLLLNSTAAEVTSTDYIDTYSAGFEISSTAPAAINASGGTFIYLAIA